MNAHKPHATWSDILHVEFAMVEKRTYDINKFHLYSQHQKYFVF